MQKRGTYANVGDNKKLGIRRFILNSAYISERAVKPFVIARKNFLFSGNADGAESTAEVFSLVQTARANGVDPEKYLAKCIELAVGIKPNDRKEWDRLLPWNLSKEFDLEY